MNCGLRMIPALSLCIVFVPGVPAGAAENGKFRVGAARIDVTPPPEEMPKPYVGVFERIYARTIVVDNGKTRAAVP
jgi:hypothetical protein